jgi:ParB family chromosome partitioning protein
MATHRIKIKEEYYKEIINGSKTFELRKNDRDYKRGDLVEFSVILKDGKILESKVIYMITYVLKGTPEYGLADDFCIFSIREL